MLTEEADVLDVLLFEDKSADCILLIQAEGRFIADAVLQRRACFRGAKNCSRVVLMLSSSCTMTSWRRTRHAVVDSFVGFAGTVGLVGRVGLFGDDGGDDGGDGATSTGSAGWVCWLPVASLQSAREGDKKGGQGSGIHFASGAGSELRRQARWRLRRVDGPLVPCPGCSGSRKRNSQW
jgi:hypothetical protein